VHEKELSQHYEETKRRMQEDFERKLELDRLHTEEDRSRFLKEQDSQRSSSLARDSSQEHLMKRESSALIIRFDPDA
jgi:hypothetical protein